MDDVKDARDAFAAEMGLARRFVESLPPGQHNITSGSVAKVTAPKSESKNWYYAVGSYRAWGKGVATVVKESSGKKAYMLDFEYHVYDRYNWDKKKFTMVHGLKISDYHMGKFHRQGLAREYDLVGVVKKSHRWGEGSLTKTLQPKYESYQNDR